ncbi:olfactory receptor 8G17-like [Phyllobates terribilis]|uniref:olfactory receptor 8G17-like n=1 Tax=Phyllobates terribilis TaxID=111132 RepID=UPI003CCAAC75
MISNSNYTTVDYFFIKGISDAPELQFPIFLLVMVIYLITLAGNMSILLLVTLDGILHTPMYYFLANLSIMDMCSSTITLHNILVTYVTKNYNIYYTDCMTQVFLFSGFEANELLLLAFMSYDRYVAVCNPLRYTVIMSFKICIYLSAIFWSMGFLQAILYVVLLYRISCYSSKLINHFFCNIIPVMELSCSSLKALEILILTEGLLLLNVAPCLLTFTPYVFIIVCILKIKTASGKRKAFYTCSSHLTVVVILYLSLGCQYLTPVSKYKIVSNKFFSFFNAAILPVLNPLIYSLRNRDVKAALMREIIMFRSVNCLRN